MPPGAEVRGVVAPPFRLSSFVGRARELEALRDELAQGRRMISVIGPAGVGKTRLAEAFACGRDAPSPVLWAEACHAHSASRFARRVAEQLGQPLPADVGDAEAIRAAALSIAAAQPALVVLDDLDPMRMPAHPLVEAILQASESVQVLVTSRTRLGLEGERVFELAPLEVPDSVEIPGEQREAVRLFLDRARSVGRAQQPSSEELETIAAICRQVDGLPLALELVAAQMRVMQPREILERLRELSPDVAPEHAPRDPLPALRTALLGSFEALGETQRAVLAGCAVFQGSFSRRAALAVLGLGTGTPGTEAEVEQVLTELADRSWLELWFAGEEHPCRFKLLFGVRQLAAEELDRRPALRQAVRRRHAQYYGAKAQRLWRALFERGDPSTARALALDMDNIRAAHAYVPSEEGRQQLGAEVRAGLAVAAARIATLRGPLWRADQALDSITEGEDSEQLPPEQRIEAWLARGAVRLARRELGGAVHDFELAEHHAEQLGPSSPLLARASLERGRALMLQDPAAAREPIERAHGLAVQHEAPILRARALDALALLRGSELRFDEARQHAEQALRMVRERGGERLHAAVLLTAGWIELATGALEQASRYYAQARDAYEFIGDRSGLAFATLQQGLAAEEDESLEQAETLYEQAAQLGRVLGHDHIRGWALCRLALVAYRRGDLDRGRQWVDAGGALLQSTTGLDAVMHHLARATIAAAEGRTPAAERELAIAETAQASAPEVRGESTLFELHRALLRVAHGRSGQPDTTCPTPDPAGPSPSEVLRTTAEMDPRHLSWLSRVTVGLLQSALQGTGPTAQNEQAPPEAPGDPPPRARALTLGPDGRWFELDGRRVDLHRHPVMRRVLAALVEQRKTTPQQRLSVDDLLQAGWPGEHMDPASGARRVYVTISRLRKLGLGDVLEHYDEGYALAPDLEVRAQGTTERGG